MSKLLSLLYVGFLEKWDPYVTDALKAECSYSTPLTHPPQNPARHQDTGAHVRQKVRTSVLTSVCKIVYLVPPKRQLIFYKGVKALE